jgi:DNA-binding transcriptional regulator PaaX
MGRMEEISQRKGRRNRIRTATLQAVQAAGLLSIALLAPNVVSTMVKLGFVSTNRQQESVARARKSLIRAGLLRVENGHLRITPKGERELRHLQTYGGLRTYPKKWDEKWRVIIFDIPERKRAVRLKLREAIIGAGFVKLQHSVWVFPYDSEQLVTLLKADLKIGTQLLYMIVDSLEGDRWLREHFQL